MATPQDDGENALPAQPFDALGESVLVRLHVSGHGHITDIDGVGE